MKELVKELSVTIKGKTVFGNNIDKKLLTDFKGFKVGFADAYVKAEDEDDVRTALQFAHKNKLPVVIRGAGTNLAGSTIPEGGIVLDMTGMNRIIELDEKAMTVTVEPGVILKDLIEYVEQRGYLYAPDPAEKEASIGGNVSTNAGGMRAVKYGVTRNYVLALDLIKIDGTKVSLGAKTYKFSTGLNLQQLIVGSEGTLGVITKIVLKLLPLPKYSSNCIVAFNSLSAGIRNVNMILKANLEPTAIEFIDRKALSYGENYTNLQFPCPQALAYLIVTLDGEKDNVQARLEKLKDEVLKNGAIEVIPLDDPEFSQNIWTIRGAIARAVNSTGIWEPVDAVVPLDKICDFVNYVYELEKDGGPRTVAFGHAGDGNVHLCILKDNITDDAWPAVLDETMNKIYKKAYELGGIASGEHGIGKGKRPYFVSHTAPEVRALMNSVKKAFDEYNLLNPHSGYAS